MRHRYKVQRVGVKERVRAYILLTMRRSLLLLFLLLLALSAVLAGLSGGVAWEAHLGGFLFGFCIGPWLAPLTWRVAAD
jgi:membrane associated rhomboid family serine protease